MSKPNENPKPDQGYAWMMLFIAFCSIFVVNGTAYSFGVLFVDFVDYFQATHRYIAFISSVMMAMMYLPCVLTGALVTCVGPRPVAFTGAVLAMAGLALSYFATSVLHLYICLGIIVGLGFGLLLFAPIVAVHTWFRKRAAFASGIIGLGTASGTFVMAPLTQWLVTVFGWKGTMLILSGITGQCVILTLLIRTAPDFEALELEYEKKYPDIEHKIEKNKPFLQHSLHSVHREAFDKTDNSNMHLHSNVAILASSLASIGSHVRSSEHLNSNNNNNKEVLLAESNGNTKKSVHLRRVFLKVIRESVDFSILKNCKLRIVLVGEFFNLILYIMPSIFLPDKAISFGIKPNHAALLLSVLSASGGVLNIPFGWVADTFVNRRPYISGACLSLVGVVNISSIYFNDFPLLAFYAIISGMQMAITSTIQAIILRDLAGVDKCAKVFGLWYLTSGVDALFVGPLMGGLYDLTKSYDIPFILAGCCSFVTAILMFILPHSHSCPSCTKQNTNGASIEAL